MLRSVRIGRVERTLLAFTTAVILAGCSGASPATPGPQQPQSLTRQANRERPAEKKSGPILFVADQGAKPVAAAVYAFADGGKFPQLWKLSGAPLASPQGLYVDGQTNLYVADASGAVFEYDAPSGSEQPGAPNLTYADTGYAPIAVAVCGDYVYAANSTGPGGGGSITVWQKGTSQPLRVTTNPAYAQGTGTGIACAGDKVYFYWWASYAGPGQIDRYAAGATGMPATLDFPSSQLFGGFTLDAAATEEVSGAIFSTFPAGKLIRALQAKWIEYPVGFAYEPGDKVLWDADPEIGALNRFTPKGKLLGQITKPASGTFGALSGVAVSPR